MIILCHLVVSLYCVMCSMLFTLAVSPPPIHPHGDRLAISGSHDVTNTTSLCRVCCDVPRERVYNWSWKTNSRALGHFGTLTITSNGNCKTYPLNPRPITNHKLTLNWPWTDPKLTLKLTLKLTDPTPTRRPSWIVYLQAGLVFDDQYYCKLAPRNVKRNPRFV